MRILYCIRLRGESVNAIDEATKEVDSYVRNIKHKPKNGAVFMTLQDKIDIRKDKWIMEGRIEGHLESRSEDVVKLMKNGNMTFEAACNILDIDENDRPKYREIISSQAVI